jgi:hypothetical protein
MIMVALPFLIGGGVDEFEADKQHGIRHRAD